MSDTKTHFGRYQLDVAEDGTATLFLDNFEHDTDFWIAARGFFPDDVLGFLKFTSISTSFFSLTEIRPANCPIHNLSTVCTRFLPPLQEET